jgi:hypothetical protein
MFNLKRYEDWKESVLSEYRDSWSDCELELSDDGTLYVHAGGAYPLTFKNVVDPYEEEL